MEIKKRGIQLTRNKSDQTHTIHRRPRHGDKDNTKKTIQLLHLN